MQGCMILAAIGTEKDTLVFNSVQIVDGRTPISHPAITYKQVR